MGKFTEARIDRQSIPQGRTRVELETGVSTSVSPTTTKFATKEELIELQKELEDTIKEQTSLLLLALIELKQATLHLASISGENITTDDIEMDI